MPFCQIDQCDVSTNLTPIVIELSQESRVSPHDATKWCHIWTVGAAKHLSWVLYAQPPVMRCLLYIPDKLTVNLSHFGRETVCLPLNFQILRSPLRWGYFTLSNPNHKPLPSCQQRLAHLASHYLVAIQAHLHDFDLWTLFFIIQL